MFSIERSGEFGWRVTVAENDRVEPSCSSASSSNFEFSIRAECHVSPRRLGRESAALPTLLYPEVITLPKTRVADSKRGHRN